ncbi:MAG TPA: MFS transporter [Rhizomicrobium sp.]|nr:MFS transporter [Rhizomicrobium sp.]
MRYQVAHPRITFAALSLIFFVVSAGAFSSLGVVLPEMVSELHWSWTDAGWGYTFLGLACGLASFVPAILIRRIGVRGDMVVGTLCMVAGFAAMAIAHSVWLYLLATCLIGLSFALVSTVPGTHVLNDIFEKRSTALGIYFTIGALGGVVGPVFYTNRLNIGVYDLTHDWRLFWVVFAIFAAVAGLFAIVATPKKHDESQHETLPPEQVSPGEMIEGLKDWTVWHALATSQFYIIVFGYTSYLLINTTAHGFAVEHLKEHGVNPKDAAAMLALEQLLGAGISVVGGVIGEWISAKAMMIVSLVALTFGMTALAYADGWPLMWVYVVGVGIGFGLSFIASTILLYNYFGKGPNLELFSIMCFISTSAAFGPLFGGWARDTLGSFSGMFLLCAAISALILLATIFMRPPVHVDSVRLLSEAAE